MSNEGIAKTVRKGVGHTANVVGDVLKKAFNRDVFGRAHKNLDASTATKLTHKAKTALASGYKSTSAFAKKHKRGIIAGTAIIGAGTAAHYAYRKHKEK